MKEKIVQISACNGGLVGLSSTGALYVASDGKWELLVPPLEPEETVLGLEHVQEGAVSSSCIDAKGRRVAMWIDDEHVKICDPVDHGNPFAWSDYSQRRNWDGDGTTVEMFDAAKEFWEINQ